MPTAISPARASCSGRRPTWRRGGGARSGAGRGRPARGRAPAGRRGGARRARGATAAALTLRVRYADHRDAEGAAPLAPATDLDVELTAAARRLTERIVTRRIALTAVGLVATLGVGHDVQLSLFDPLPPAVRRRDLNDAIDRVRRRYGTTSIGYALG